MRTYLRSTSQIFANTRVYLLYYILLYTASIFQIRTHIQSCRLEARVCGGGRQKQKTVTPITFLSKLSRNVHEMENKRAFSQHLCSYLPSLLISHQYRDGA